MIERFANFICIRWGKLNVRPTVAGVTVSALDSSGHIRTKKLHHLPAQNRR